MPERSAGLLQDRIDKLLLELPGALAGDAEAVHQMRVAARRLRAALPLLAIKPHGGRVRRARRALHALTRCGGESRDFDVGLELLAGRIGVLGNNRERRVLLSRLRRARTRARRAMVSAIAELDVTKMHRELRAVLSRGTKPGHVVLQRIARTRERRGDVLLAQIDAHARRFDPEALHRLRRHARRLRYVAEVADALRGEDSAIPDVFKQVQDELGHLHDAAVLAAWLGAAADALQGGDAAAAAEARSLARFFLSVARKYHRAFLADPPALRVRRALLALRANTLAIAHEEAACAS
jgi:CHAD domain-containing protein